MKIKLEYPVRIFRVRSTSEPDLFHEVVLYSDGSFSCDCQAGLFNRECKHKIKVRKFLNKNNGRKKEENPKENSG